MAAAGCSLHPACRVRAEKFGLLFYDLRGPRLLFAETGALLKPDFFQGKEPVDAFLHGCPPTADEIWFAVSELLAGRVPVLPNVYLRYG